MKELQQILKKITCLAPDEKAVLATVIDVEGSSYRRAGARMLIAETGETFGTVSGGCLEADVLEQAKKVLETGKPTIITYDTTENENSVFGLGMGCRGIVKILLESAQNNVFFDFVRECFQHRATGALATIIKKPENSPFEIGAKIFFGETETPNDFGSFDFTGDAVSDNLTFDIWHILEGKRTALKTYETAYGTVEFFVEKIEPPLALFVFGAGFDAIPLVEIAKSLGWRVLLIDHREAWATAERFPEADDILVSRAENLPEMLFQDENSVAVLMTHNYERDQELLPRLLHKNFLYVGALGPKKRTEQIIAECDEIFTTKELQRLHAPIGLDIGAETPEQIALSIIAEIQSVLANRTGGFLRERNAGIH